MKAGVHLPNDGRMNDQDLALVQGLALVKGLVRLDADCDELDWGRLAGHLRGDCTVVLRLYYPGRLDAAEFVNRSARKLPGVLEALGGREVLIEIHNEPNHAEGIEGSARGPGPTGRISVRVTGSACIATGSGRRSWTTRSWGATGAGTGSGGPGGCLQPSAAIRLVITKPFRKWTRTGSGPSTWSGAGWQLEVE